MFLEGNLRSVCGTVSKTVGVETLTVRIRCPRLKNELPYWAMGSYRDDNWVDWDDAVHLQSVLYKSTSRSDTLRNLGYHPGAPISRKKLNDAIKRFNLDVSSFSTRTERWDILPRVIKNCFSISDVLRAVGLQDQGDNHKTAKRYIEEFKLDTSHFHSKRTGGGVSSYTKTEIFCKNSKAHRRTVRDWVIREKLLPYECHNCKLTEWQNKPLVLDLDHINGINNDHRLENLRFLCPNCHSQTPTHRGHNRK